MDIDNDKETAAGPVEVKVYASDTGHPAEVPSGRTRRARWPLAALGGVLIGALMARRRRRRSLQ